MDESLGHSQEILRKYLEYIFFYKLLEGTIQCFCSINMALSGVNILDKSCLAKQLLKYPCILWALSNRDMFSAVLNGPPLYAEKGLDKDNLITYKYSRGKISVKGVCHMNIIRRFASYNISFRLKNLILADYHLYHNINVSLRQF